MPKLGMRGVQLAPHVTGPAGWLCREGAGNSHYQCQPCTQRSGAVRLGGKGQPEPCCGFLAKAVSEKDFEEPRL